jgi:hypothetical protein
MLQSDKTVSNHDERGDATRIGIIMIGILKKLIALARKLGLAHDSAPHR